MALDQVLTPPPLTLATTALLSGWAWMARTSMSPVLTGESDSVLAPRFSARLPTAVIDDEHAVVVVVACVVVVVAAVVVVVAAVVVVVAAVVVVVPPQEPPEAMTSTAAESTPVPPLWLPAGSTAELTLVS